MGLLVVQARAMAEVIVLAEVLPMVGGDDDPGVRKLTRRAQVAEKASKLGVQSEQALVVNITKLAADALEFPLAVVRALLAARPLRARRAFQPLAGEVSGFDGAGPAQKRPTASGGGRYGPCTSMKFRKRKNGRRDSELALALALR